MKTSDKGINLIKKYEGLRLKAYKCPAGVWTIGYGHTQGVKPNMTITEGQADAYLLEDLEKIEAYVNAYDSTYHWTQNEFDALVSFTFNCGKANLKNLLKEGRRSKQEISTHIPSYNKAAGVTLSGLVKRRKEEQALFNTITIKVESADYYPMYIGSSVNIDEVMEAIGATLDYDYLAKSKYLKRLPIAKANGIADYKGSAEQNKKLINLAREGWLRRV